MIELEKFPDHLQTLQLKDWESLFILLPEIEMTSSFGELKGGESLNDRSISMPFWSSSEIVDKTFTAIRNLNLCPVFDWLNWQEGNAILNNQAFDYDQLDTILLCKLFTVIIRADRFNEGYLIACFENGIITKIIRSLKENIMKRSR
jgi:hypothetical protein